MERLRTYEISFSGLKFGTHLYEFHINKKFFDLFQVNTEFTDCDIKAKIEVEKTSNLLNIKLKTKGTMQLICDISEKEYAQKVKNDMKFVIKFGETFDDSEDELLTLPNTAHSFNVAQYIYESIMLSIPMKHIHPDIDENYHNEVLDKYLVNELPENEENIEKEIDPRWEKLRNINKENLN